MYSAGVIFLSYWNSPVILEIYFFPPFLTDMVIVCHLRLFLHDIADENTSLAQEAHDSQVVVLWKSYHGFLSFL